MRRRRAVLWFVLVASTAACGGRAAQAPVANTGDVEESRGLESLKPSSFVSAPRPELDVEQLVPDFHEELRWPLSSMSHPELAPKYEIAAVFAQPGVGFIELCERGVQNRVTSGRNRDELDYLRGWCSAVKGDADAACGKLGPLVSSPVLGLSAAIRTDIANIIANNGDFDAAEHLLAKHRLDDLDLLDTLSATYIEIGRSREAYEINKRALDSVGRTTSADECRRLVRDIVLRDDHSLSTQSQQLHSLATTGKLPDPICASLYHALKCWQTPGYGCEEYFRDVGIDPLNRYLLAAYRAWPREGDHREWLSVADDAIKAHPIAGSEELALVAFDAASKASGECPIALDHAVHQALKVLSPRAKKQLDSILDSCHPQAWKK